MGANPHGDGAWEGTSKRTPSQVAVALEAAGLARQHGRYGVISVATDHGSLPKVGV